MTKALIESLNTSRKNPLVRLQIHLSQTVCSQVPLGWSNLRLRRSYRGLLLPQNGKTFGACCQTGKKSAKAIGGSSPFFPVTEKLIMRIFFEPTEFFTRKGPDGGPGQEVNDHQPLSSSAETYFWSRLSFETRSQKFFERKSQYPCETKIMLL